MSRLLKDHLELHFIVLLWGFTAVIGVLISLPPISVVFFRTLLAFMVLGLLLILLKENFQVEKKDLFKMIGVGFIFSIHWILFFLSARVSNVSICLSGLATAALWTSLVEPVVGRRRIRLMEIVLSLIAITGISIIFGVEIDRYLGLTLAIVSAFLYAVFSVINKHLVVRYSHFVIMFYEMLGAFIATTLYLPIYTVYMDESISLVPRENDWFFLLILSVVCTVYTFSTSVKLMKRLSAFALNLTTNLEPVYGIVLALLILGQSEHMQFGFYLGAGLIVLSVAIYPLWLKSTRN